MRRLRRLQVRVDQIVRGTWSARPQRNLPSARSRPGRSCSALAVLRRDLVHLAGGEARWTAAISSATGLAAQLLDAADCQASETRLARPRASRDRRSWLRSSSIMAPRMRMRQKVSKLACRVRGRSSRRTAATRTPPTEMRSSASTLNEEVARPPAPPLPALAAGTPPPAGCDASSSACAGTSPHNSSRGSTRGAAPPVSVRRRVTACPFARHRAAGTALSIPLYCSPVGSRLPSPRRAHRHGCLILSRDIKPPPPRPAIHRLDRPFPNPRGSNRNSTRPGGCKK